MCVTELIIDSKQVNGLGKYGNQTSFWLDKDDVCDESRMYSGEVTIRNGSVLSSACKSLSDEDKGEYSHFL